MVGRREKGGKEGWRNKERKRVDKRGGEGWRDKKRGRKEGPSETDWVSLTQEENRRAKAHLSLNNKITKKQ